MRETAGDPRWEFFAVRDDGDESYAVQLTTQFDLQPDHWRDDEVWVPGDGLFSFRAVHWDAATGQPIGAGIYLAALEFDAGGNVVGLAGQPDPDAPVVPLPLEESAPGVYSDRIVLSGFSWSSDGRLAWASADRLYVTHWLNAPDVDELIAEGHFLNAPVWSPDNSRIAFDLSRDIVSVRPDGTQGIVHLTHEEKGKTETTFRYPKWSPDGQDMICWRINYDNRTTALSISNDLVRFAADSSDRDVVSLTGEVTNGQVLPLGWR